MTATSPAPAPLRPNQPRLAINNNNNLHNDANQENWQIATPTKTKVIYYLSHSQNGAGGRLAQRAKSWFQQRGVTVHDRWTSDDENAAGKILASRAFIVLLDEAWLKQAECEYDYNIAQLQNLTASKPIIFPVLSQDLSALQHNALLSAVRSNLSIHAFPALDFWRVLGDEEEEESLFRQMSRILETVLMKHLPDLPRSPECEIHEAKFAERLSEMEAKRALTRLNGLSLEMPSGKWVGVMIGTGRQRMKTKAKLRWPLEVYIRFEEANPDSFCGHGRDDVGFFLMKGNLKEERQKVNFFLVYIDMKEEGSAALHTLSFTGGCHGVCMTGKWRIHDRSTPIDQTPSSGYWAMWPESFISLELLDKCLRKYSTKFKKFIPQPGSEDEEAISDMSDTQSESGSEMLNSSLDDSSLQTSGSFIYDDTRPPIQNMTAETAAAVSDIMTALDEQMDKIPPEVANLVRRLSFVLTSPPATPLMSPTATPLPDSASPPDYFQRKGSMQ